MDFTDEDPNQDTLNERVRKLKGRQEATKREIEHIEKLCLAEKDMKQRSADTESTESWDGSCDCYTTCSTSAISTAERYRLPRGKNKSFSSYEVREIERQNAILIKKIDANNKKPVRCKVENTFYNRTSNSQVTRKKKELQIDTENKLLFKKIQAAKPFGLSKRK